MSWAMHESGHESGHEAGHEAEERLNGNLKGGTTVYMVQLLADTVFGWDCPDNHRVHDRVGAVQDGT